MKHWYKNLENRFSAFPADIQILNLVSDLNKARNLWSGNEQSARNHLFRAIILLDYIIEDKKWKTKLKELLRLREAIGAAIFENSRYGDIQQIINAALLLNPKAYKSLRNKKA